MRITGAKHLVKALKFEGVDTVFVYPGGYVNDIFDELTRQEEIHLVLGRHEQALVHEADGYARATGKTGVCIVTSGPGATNLVTGLATATYDSVPLVCFTGQVPRDQIGNDAFQEVDIVGITRSVTKHSVLVNDRDELPRIIKEAFYIARTGRPGPVLVDLPADLMKELREEHFPQSVNIRSYRPNSGIHIGQLKRAMTELKKAQRPVFLIGGGVNIAHAGEALQELVEKTNVPVVTTIMGKGALPTDHKLLIGNSGMHGSYASNMALVHSDLIFSIGARFSDRTTGNLEHFAENAKIIHIDIDTASISRTVKVDIPIVADAKVAITKMLDMAEDFQQPAWLEQIEQWKEQHPLQQKQNLEWNPQTILQEINRLDGELLVTTDVGQHQMWTTQYLEMNRHRQLIMSGGLGTMGYGFPAAIGAKLACPDKRVLCITGDGGFQMNMQEMATAVCQQLPIIVLIFNNNYLGMVRQMQQLFLEQRYSLTCLKGKKACNFPSDVTDTDDPNYVPNFVKWAESYGVKGFRVKTKEELADALKEACNVTDRPTVIECLIKTEELVMPMVKSGTSLGDMILEEE